MCRKKNLPDPEISRTPLKTPPPSKKHDNYIHFLRIFAIQFHTNLQSITHAALVNQLVNKADTPTSSPSVISIQESDDGVTRNLLEDDDY
ncbi:hypothetical protein J4Q44_G00385340 [Coregonus suidteri]|uniref:Uncharacterized protein n=1 Tax=Coregonus suidteri TaxID=861788 RepID=A0AAN8Q991_9TELE